MSLPAITDRGGGEKGDTGGGTQGGVPSSLGDLGPLRPHFWHSKPHGRDDPPAFWGVEAAEKKRLPHFSSEQNPKAQPSYETPENPGGIPQG